MNYIKRMSYIKKDENIYIDVFKSNNISFHAHDFFELAYVIEGEGTHLQRDSQAHISVGDYFIIDYNTYHAYGRTPDNLSLVNCLFLPEFIDRSLLGCRNFAKVLNNYLIKFSYDFSDTNPAGFVFHDDDGNVKQIILRLLREYREKRPGYLEIMRCDLIELIILTMRKISVKDENVMYGNYSKYLTDYISKHYNERIKLSDAAESLNFSVPYLSKLFKDDTGITFSEYLQKTRIEQSCRLLANTDKKITEIASLVGYTDTNFFGRLFKKQLGITPRAFRSNIMLDKHIVKM